MEHDVPNKGKRKIKYINLNGFKYTEGSTCPSCSGETDTGGRLVFKKRTNWFLKCEKCKYTIQTYLAKKKQETYLERKHDRDIGIIQTDGRKIKKLKITKKVAKEIKRMRALQKAKRQYE